MKINKAAVLALVGESLQLKAVTADGSMENLRNWDSLSHIQVMLTLEKRLGLKVPAHLFGELTSVAAILEFLEDEGRLATEP